jgi:hypothetical protein
MYKYRCVRVFLLVWFHFVGLNLDVREIGRTTCNSDSNVVCIMRRVCGLLWGGGLRTECSRDYWVGSR